jgi:two-component system, chemotaxis family, CheB/CheR fusion protein
MKKKRTVTGSTETVPAKKSKPDDDEIVSLSKEPFPESPTVTPQSNDFPIVGIGASAGGLAAFEAFFSGMPADIDPGMAFVLVQHLAPDHKSILTELIRRYTRMQVFEVEDGIKVQPNCAYIIPPNRDMAFFNGTLQLLEPSAPRGRRLPIDFFFRSLAQDRRERAICIVLSGTGSDGTQGVRAIKGEGGMIMAQSSDSTEYDGMPRSAIATGLVDYVLQPAEMPAQLIAYVSHAFSKPFKNVDPLESKTDNALRKIFVLLRTQTGHDFFQYKPSTIHRRIERRLAVHQIETIDAYVKYLQQTPSEVEALFRDLLIGVTSFFRDQHAFMALEEKVIPQFYTGKFSEGAVRIWTPGCSTGEEPYSIAILLQEHLEKLKQSAKVQIFATDIDAQAIATARAGIYPASIAADISAERLARFFSAQPESDTYRIHKTIRDILVFSEQDVIRDPPFSKLDLICCRNLLIYMAPDLQKKLISLFHYALKPDGILFLGTSESVGELGDLFTVLDRKAKLYTRKEEFLGVRRTALSRMGSRMTMPENAVTWSTQNKAFPAKVSLREVTEQALLQHVAPAAALVNGHGDILYLHGRTGMFLEPAAGDAGINNILKMAREGLRHELTAALHKAAATKEIISRMGLGVKTNGDFTATNFTICPVTAGAATIPEAPLFLVVLEEAPSSDPLRSVPVSAGSDLLLDVDKRIIALKQELQAKEEYLQTTNEELETFNEELKSSNEEMQSVNEELQSTNEELETSKEELQSVNEELATVNAELQTKVIDLTRLNNDMNNLLGGTGIGTVFVDYQMRILRFTPTATRIINLILSDVGRPVSHIVSNLVGYDHMVPDVQAVLDTLVPKEVDVQTTEGKWYRMRILPYRTLDNVIEGAVLTFFDVTEVKKADEIIKHLLEEKELILKEVHHRIKNHMNTINSLLSIQAAATKDPVAAAALKDAGSRVQSMMVLYEKLYQSDNYHTIPVLNYLPPLVDDIVANFTGSVSVKIEKRIGEFVLDVKRLQTIGIIINELLTNIMKYAFTGRNEGRIVIAASLTEGRVSLVIQDNGNGMPESIDFENSTGFGLVLVGMLTKQLQGTIRIERENGTRIVLEFEK